MQHAEQIRASSPWRTATVIVGAIAALELVVLIGIGAERLVPQHRTASPAKPAPTATHRAVPVPVRHVAPPPTHPLRPRSRVQVLVLNGNGISGAASTTAQHLQIRGYRIGAAENAQRHDYARSMVMYAPGWVKEARRLAHDEGMRLVAPVDGLTPAKLKGSQIVLILGNS